jgi:hypothetical protein
VQIKAWQFTYKRFFVHEAKQHDSSEIRPQPATRI